MRGNENALFCKGGNLVLAFALLRRFCLIFIFSHLLVACSPVWKPAEGIKSPIGIDPDGFHTMDGMTLPLQFWGNVKKPKAVILALHGFGDYANAFDELGLAIKDRNIALYAFDQRGFGRSATRPFWAGSTTMVNDASDMLIVLRARYPDVPIYLLGNSMGGAVAILAAANRPQLMDGLILVAPAVWSRDMMRWYETVPLAVVSHLAPWLPLSGRGLDIWPSNNIEMLRRLAKDPWMMSSVRADMVKGLVDLMDQAHMQAREIRVPTLLLSGKHDQVIPQAAINEIATGLEKNHQKTDTAYTRCVYEAGFHMLLRDNDGPVVLSDIFRWIQNPEQRQKFQCSETRLHFDPARVIR